MIAIVGAGITGLALARELTARDVECVVLESSDRVGGVIRSGRVDGHVLDWGPQRMRLTKELGSLIRDLGLTQQVVSAPAGLGLFVYREGRLRRVPFSMAELVRSDIVSFGAKVRLGLEPLTVAARPDESVARFFVRKLGREVYENVVGPLYGGLYASDPKDMVVGLSLAHVLERFGVDRSLVLAALRRGGEVVSPAACSFVEGLETLPRAMAATLSEKVLLEMPVRGLTPRSGGWRVASEAAELDVSAVVLTTPAGVTARLLKNIAPDAARRAGTLRYNQLAVVHLHSAANLRGFGFQVSLAEDLSLRGVTFNHSLFERVDVYTAFLGGSRHPQVVQLPDDELARLAVAEFRLCTGFDARALAVSRQAMPAWDRSWSALQGFELPRGIHVASNWVSRPGIPGRFADAAVLAEELSSKR